MPITGAETNELLADKPKTKEEKKMERIQKKIDKLEKKQNKFNEKLAELNKNEAQTETEIVTKTRDNMNIVTGLETTNTSLTSNTTTGEINLGFQKNIYDNNNTITVGVNVGVGTQLNNNPTQSVPTSVDVPGETSGGDIMAGNGLDEGDGLDNTGSNITTSEIKSNTTNTMPSNTYITPELYIKSKNDKGITLGGVVGGKFNIGNNSKQKTIYTQGSLGYETKSGLGIQAIGGVKANIVGLTKTPVYESNGGTAEPGIISGNTSPDNEGDGNNETPIIVQHTETGSNVNQNNTIEKNTKINVSAYGGLKLYKNFGDFGTYIGGTISGTGPTVTGGVTYKF